MPSRIALTFDDGPSEWTGPILELLRDHGARATFFVVGSIAQERADLIHRIAEEGHELGNHSWSHPSLAADCDDERVHEELERTNNAIADIVGRRPRRFRAPHYSVDERVEAIATRLGLVHTGSDVAPPDWHPRINAAVTATFVLQQLHPGAVVTLHDGIPPGEAGTGQTRQATVDAVATVLPRLADRFEFVTASDLLDGETEL